MKTLINAWIVFALMFISGAVHARLEITITGGMEGALPIAVVPFGFEGQAQPPSDDVGAIIAADLARSGRFNPISASDLPARPHQGSEINFKQWRDSGSDTMVVGKVIENNGSYLIRFQLFDILSGKQIIGYSMPSRGTALRRTAHQISDLIYEKLTGEPGAFSTHVAYVTQDTDADGERRYRLAVADADGFNEQVILTSQQSLMSPAWSPEGKRLAYVSFEKNRPMVYVQNVITGQREVIANFKGINSAPSWSPDGSRLAVTLSKDGNPEIYIINLVTKALTRITQHYAIDTEPTWLPDGSGLIFTSDRGGSPQLYTQSVNSRGAVGKPKRLTFEGRYNARASIAPNGKDVAMIHQSNRGFQIGVLNLGSGNFQVLTESRLDESPSFSPNGSMIIYATEVNGRGVLEAVSIDGRAHQRLGLNRGDVREPAWSPFSTK